MRAAVNATAPETYRRDLEAPLDAARRAAAEAAEAWGTTWVRSSGAFDDGELELTVAAGLRRGLARGRLHLEALSAESTRATYAVYRSEYHLHHVSVVILAFAALGAAMVIVAPFLPGDAVGTTLLIPVGALLAISGWFLVNARLRAETPEDFLREIEAHLEPLDPPRDGEADHLQA